MMTAVVTSNEIMKYIIQMLHILCMIAAKFENPPSVTNDHLNIVKVTEEFVLFLWIMKKKGKSLFYMYL